MNLVDALPGKFKALPPRIANRPGAVVRIRLETAVQAARPQFQVEAIIARGKQTTPAMAEVWCAVERPPSVQAQRRALMQARDQLEQGATREDLRLEFGASNI